LVTLLEAQCRRSDARPPAGETAFQRRRW